MYQNTTFCKFIAYAPYFSTLIGDANNSGEVTITDAILTANYILREQPTPFFFQQADVNRDNRITITDVMQIINIILGL